MSRQFCTPSSQISLTPSGQAAHADWGSVLSPQALTVNTNPNSNPRMIFVCAIALLPLRLVKATEADALGRADVSQGFSAASREPRPDSVIRQPYLYLRRRGEVRVLS